MASFHVILIFLLGVTQALHTLSSRADPILNIQKIAFSLKKDDSTIEYGFYGIFVKFSEDSQKIFARDEHVAGLALKAYEEAKAVKEEEEKPTNEQLGLAGMAVLLVGDEAYFASPMRRIWTTDLSNSKDVPQYFMYDVLGGNVPLRQQLLQCRLQVVNDTPNEKSKPRIKPQHNNNGNCGEIVAMQMWHLNHPGEQWPGSKNNKIAKVTYWWGAQERIIKPCNAANVAYAWGCLQFAETHGIDWVKPGFTRDTVQRITTEEMNKIIDTRPIHDTWCKIGDNPIRQGEPPDAGPAGSPDASSEPDWDTQIKMLKENSYMDFD